METLRRRLAELMEDGEKREMAAKEDRSQVDVVWCCAGVVVVVVVANGRLFCVSWQRVCPLWRRS